MKFRCNFMISQDLTMRKLGDGPIRSTEEEAKQDGEKFVANAWPPLTDPTDRYWYRIESVQES